MVKKRILLVEDNPIVAQACQILFEGEGYLVEVVSDGQVSLQQATTLPHPDVVVITAVESSQLNGFEICQKFKESPYLAGLPVIMLGQYTELETIVRAYKVGADYYVVKDNHDYSSLLRLVEVSLKSYSGRVF